MVNFFDLSPLPPDVMVQQDAERWMQAVVLRSAIAQGVADARDEKAALDVPVRAYGQVG